MACAVKTTPLHFRIALIKKAWGRFTGWFTYERLNVALKVH